MWAVGDASPYTYVAGTIMFVGRRIEGDWFDLRGVNQAGVEARRANAVRPYHVLCG